MLMLANQCSSPDSKTPPAQTLEIKADEKTSPKVLKDPNLDEASDPKKELHKAK